ncbi:MAG: hypothetical protein FWH41_02920 [Treponema sp.]|nr:hypothetical protein [Treponema sp.]
MTIEQTVEIPPDYRIFLELPRSIPVSAKARIEISFPSMNQKSQTESAVFLSKGIEDIRLLLRQEMTEKGTLTVTSDSGDGWEAHVSER